MNLVTNDSCHSKKKLSNVSYVAVHTCYNTELKDSKDQKVKKGCKEMIVQAVQVSIRVTLINTKERLECDY